MSRMTILRNYQILAALAIAGLLLLVWFLRYPIALIFLSYIVAATFEKPTKFLEKKGVPRFIAIALLFLLIGGTVALISYIFIREISSDVFLKTDFAAYVRRIHFDNISGIVQKIILSVQDELARNLVNITKFTGLIIGSILTVTISSIYLLASWKKSHENLYKTFGKWEERVRETVIGIEISLGAWVRGQSILSLIVGLSVFISMYFMGISYAPALGFIAGILEFIPYAGPIVSSIPALIIAASTNRAVEVGIVYLVIYQVESQILAPIIMKNATELHPVIVIFSIICGYELMGPLGALLSIPLVSAISVAIKINLPKRVTEGKVATP